ncbi:MAG: hypothetical protein PUH99_06725 [Firmicutes bacterium]|nr:hypothetical protein [Bacillota bacterium]MDY5531681.1 hypothetical protein [Pumilibacteraceae bacterium]
MNNIMNFLGVAAWISESFPVIRIVLLILTVLCCAVVIVLALVSPVGTEDGNVITGGETADTFYSQNKSKMNEGLVKKLMIAFSIVTAVLIVLFYITVIMYKG